MVVCSRPLAAAERVVVPGQIGAEGTWLLVFLWRCLLHVGPAEFGCGSCLTLFLLLLQGDYASAEPLLYESLAMKRNELAADHPSIGPSLINLSAALQRQGKFDAAAPLMSVALDIYRKRLPEIHP